MVSILLLYLNFPPLRSTIQWSPFNFFIYHFNFLPRAFHTAMVYNVILHLDLLPAVHKAMVYNVWLPIYIYIIYIYIYTLQKPTYVSIYAFWTLKQSLSARLPSKMDLRSSKTKLFCETSFKNEGSKLKNEAVLRDFLQKCRFETQKRRFCSRLPSKMKLRNSKTKLFCETSFKNEGSKLKNEGFVRDFLQKWSFETQKPSFSARLPSKMILRARIGSQATTKGTHQFCVTGVGLQAHLVTCDPIYFGSKCRNSE